MSGTWLKTALPVGACLVLAACSAKVVDGGSRRDPDLDKFLVGAAGSGNGNGSSGAGGSTRVRSPDRCVEGRANAERVQPRVILVLDGSCSMSTDYPANGEQSATECTANQMGRWAALRNALVDPQVGVVPQLQHLVQFGLAVYGTNRTCPIPEGHMPVRPALNNADAIASSMPQVQPGMYTPTGAALDWVYENMIEEYSPDVNLGPQIVILATDGEPNSCDGGGGRRGANYQPSVNAVMNGTDKGVTTYVVSLADATGDFHDHLQELANLGNPAANGSAQLYEPSSPAELASDIQTLVGGAIGCDIVLDGSLMPGSECAGTVMVNGAPVACNDPNGFTAIDPRHIRLQGTSCQMLMDRNVLVEARFPCSSFSPE
jgi:hypothetical protein